MRTYSELILIPTFEERFEYLKMGQKVGDLTFSYERFLNQNFYKSKEWLRVRDEVIIRDNACDLAMQDGDHHIGGMILVHHLNPFTAKDLKDNPKLLLDPEFLVCTSKLTHNAIHFGDKNLLPKPFVERRPNDTVPWK